MLAGRKTVQKGGFGPTCGFFFREKLADGLISLKVFIEFTWLHIRPHKVTAKKGRLDVWPNTDILPSLHGAWNVLFGSWFGPSVFFFPKRQNWVGMPRFTMWLRLLACKHLLTNNERRLLQSCGYLDNKNIKEHRVLDHDHSREDFNLCKTKKMYTPLRSQFIPPIGQGTSKKCNVILKYPSKTIKTEFSLDCLGWVL